jgi:hypothetical protein
MHDLLDSVRAGGASPRCHRAGRGEVVAMLVNRAIRSTRAPITSGISLMISSFLRLEGLDPARIVTLSSVLSIITKRPHPARSLQPSGVGIT